VGKPDTMGLVRLSLLSATIASIGAVPRVMLRASRRVRIVAMLNIAAVLFTTLPTVWLVVVQQQGVRGVVIGILIGDICTALASFACTIGEFRLAFSRPVWKSMLSYGLPFVPHHLQAVGLIVFGQYMVREMLGLDEAGLYNVATKFAMPVSFVVNAVQNSWAAYKFQIHAEDENPAAFFRSTFTYYIAALTYLWVGVALWGPEVVRLMTGPAFHDASLLIWATGLVPVVQGIYYMSGTGMELSNNTRPFPLVSLAGLVTVIGSAMILVPASGALGAAWATALGWGAMSAVMYYFAQRRLSIDYDWTTAAGFGLLALGFVGAGYYLQSSPLSLRLASAICISLAYPAIAVALLLRSRDERHRMHILLSKLKLAGGR
jgi:O-antigen/teichoic acid export membrane protein